MHPRDDKKAQLVSLISEFEKLDKGKNPSRAREILAEGSLLVNRDTQPKKWAAFRYAYAQYSETIDPPAAIDAYREALGSLDAETDAELVLSCKKDLGLLLINQLNYDAEEYNEVIDLLEAAEVQYPELALKIAILYQFYPTGDPWKNWNKRFSEIINGFRIPFCSKQAFSRYLKK